MTVFVITGGFLFSFLSIVHYTKKDIHQAVSELHKLGPICITVTLGKDGTFLSLNCNCQSKVIPCISIKAIDTTGAGDAFVGATLYQLSTIENLYRF